MKIFYGIVSAFFMLTGINAAAFAQSVTAESDQWSFTDGVGRVARGYDEAGQRREEKFVGVFYWTWHENRHDESRRVINVPKVVAEHPEALNDYNSPYWGGSQKPDVFFWSEPLFGYYQTTDKWVLRKHAEMLADAGVDVVFFDCSNGSFLWLSSVDALCETWIEAMHDGVNVPKIAFLLPFTYTSDSLASLRNLYSKYYSKGLYRDLWFYWEGKPLILAYPDNLTSDKTDQIIKNYFSFRPCEPGYNTSTKNFPHRWSWLQVYPQKLGYMNYNPSSPSYMQYEQISVGVAQNARDASGGRCCAFNLPDTYGRSYSKNKGWDPRPDAYLYGWNFQEQWNYAMTLDPNFIFVTGWNEFHSGMWTSLQGWSDPLSFVDQYDWEHSRDCEPTADWGDKGDAYYWQLVDQIRRYKGMAEPVEVSDPVTITLGNSADWDGVLPRYVAYKGNTLHRDHDGYYETHYTNTSGRNDIVGAQVARDSRNLYFRVETAEPLTPSTGHNWMQLFIDVDRDKSTGWYGYDFVINHTSPTAEGAVLQSCVGNQWSWQQTAVVEYSISGNVLEIAVPLSALNITSDIDIEFKWNDNMQDEGNIMDFYVNGDSAPGGRFNYVYTASSATSGIDTVSGTISAFSATPVYGGIYVESDREVVVYNLTGAVVARGSGCQTLPVSTPGLYIVSDGVDKIKLSVTR
ncbi:MAG: hypothetical protein K2M98_04735 [Muribaculum sp.]|nr:hypothetical protein [Muribaculum sp.]